MFSPFKTYQHYDFDKNEKQIEDNNCCICYEMLDSEGNPCVKLSKQKYYNKECSCDVDIHIYCLHKWVTLHLSCPICRGWLAKNTTILSCSMREYSYYVSRHLPRTVACFLFCYLCIICISKSQIIIENIETTLGKIGEEKMLSINNISEPKRQLRDDGFFELHDKIIFWGFIYCFLQYIYFLKNDNLV